MKLKNKKVVILHQEVSADSTPDELDVLDQVKWVKVTLREMGYDPIDLALTLEFEEISRNLRAIAPLFVFNLVESIAGKGQFIHLAPLLLDELQIPYTGCSAKSLALTSNKPLAKKKLRATGLATPEWVSNAKDAVLINEPYIIKAVWEHASVGLSNESIFVPQEVGTLYQKILETSRKMGLVHFAERYIHGREFNVALLGGTPLPASEIRFLDKTATSGAYQVLGYRAKWDETSQEYQCALPSFEFSVDDLGLVSELSEMAKKCWTVFGLRGYARVDFRIDPTGRPWILEVNANPCLTPGSGFHNATLQAGIAFSEVIQSLIQEMNQRPKSKKPQTSRYSNKKSARIAKVQPKHQTVRWPGLGFL